MFPTVTCWWRRWLAVGIPGVMLLVLLLPARTRSQAPREAQGRPLSPFLETFLGRKSPKAVTQTVVVSSAVGRVSGYLARPDTPERLPAVLLLDGQEKPGPWMQRNARDLAEIGYVVLVLDLPGDPNERMLVELSAAVRWLRRRADVWPGSVGVVGWSKGAAQALALAAATPLQACVLCDGSLPNDPSIIAGLRGTPVLILAAGKRGSPSAALTAFRRALTDAHNIHRIRVYDDVPRGFMGPREQGPHVKQEADRAYSEIYEFLGTYVEDSSLNNPWVRPLAVQHAGVASIMDLMLAANARTGVRDTLATALAHKPTNQQQWDHVRACAALLAEVGTLLQAQTPPRGPHGDWVAQARAYTADAEAIVDAGDRRDYAAARRGLQALSSRCAACHRQHRGAE
jgi:dienelactone hydrolase